MHHVVLLFAFANYNTHFLVFHAPQLIICLLILPLATHAIVITLMHELLPVDLEFVLVHFQAAILLMVAMYALSIMMMSNLGVYCMQTCHFDALHAHLHFSIRDVKVRVASL